MIILSGKPCSTLFILLLSEASDTLAKYTMWREERVVQNQLKM